jgi:hypothetical protein
MWSAFKYFSESSKNNKYITYESVISALKYQNIAINEQGIKSYFNELKNSGIRMDFEVFKKIIQI